MMKKLALLLAMSGVSFVANGAETLMIEATYQESMTSGGRMTAPGELSTRYEANCKIYDSGKTTVELKKYDYDSNAAMAAMSVSKPPIDYNQFKKNNKTIISTSTKFTIDATFLKDAVNEAVLDSEFYNPTNSDYSDEFFVYKNKKKMKASSMSLSSMMSGNEYTSRSEKLSKILTAMCNQHGVRQAVVGCGMGGGC